MYKCKIYIKSWSKNEKENDTNRTMYEGVKKGGKKTIELKFKLYAHIFNTTFDSCVCSIYVDLRKDFLQSTTLNIKALFIKKIVEEISLQSSLLSFVSN